MRPNTIRDTVRGIFLGMLIVVMMVVGVLLASPSRADGIVTADEEAVGDAVASTLCEYLDNNGVNRASMMAAMTVLYRNTPQDMDMTDAVDIINYSVYNYCPEYWPQLVAFGEGARS